MQSVLLECAVRALLAAACTAAALALLRVRTAAPRHAAWSGVVVLMLLLPLWTAWGPRAALRVLPRASARTVAAVHALSTAGTAPVAAPPVVLFLPTPVRPRWSWPRLALGAYLLGVCAMLLRLAIGTLRARHLIRRAAPEEGVLVSPSCSTPVTVGWLHPAVILPPDWRHWPEGKLNAVLAHEREHARRRDPLMQWLALVNRALFWFHPLAWWLERHTCALAEEACDAAAIAQGHDPRDYSAYLLEFARDVEHSGLRIRQWGMAMPGGFLAPRIRRILADVPTPRTSRARLACAAAACALTALVCTTGRLDLARAQSAVVVPAGPEFENVSVQIIPPYSGGDFTPWKYRPPAPGTFDYWHTTLRGLVMQAYGVEEYQVEGGDGTDTNPRLIYTITVKAPPRDMPKEQVNEMLRRLLAGRFGLVLHREPKLVPVYYLVAGPNALQGLTPEQEGKDSLTSHGPGKYHARKVPLSHLAFALSHSQPRYVLDKTGIRGAYTFNLDWTLDDTEWGRYSRPRRPGFDPSPDHPLSPSLVSALDRLGLKLEPHEDLMDVLVIDRAEEPPRNQ